MIKKILPPSPSSCSAKALAASVSVLADVLDALPVSTIAIVITVVNIIRTNITDIYVLTADELNWTDPHQVDPVTRRVIGYARQRHEADWLQGCRARTAVQFSLVSLL